jgi:hypothetical protein
VEGEAMTLDQFARLSEKEKDEIEKRQAEPARTNPGI